MNRYLEKIASPGEEVGKAKEPLQAKDPGSKLLRGAKTLFQHAQVKVASVKTMPGEPTDWKKDSVNTAVIGGLGGAAGFASNKFINKAPQVFGEATKFHNAKVFALGTGLGLAADYAGLKINHSINKHLDKVASLFPSVKYQKTLDKDENKEYHRAYTTTPSHSFGQAVGASVATGIGTVGGLAAGKAIAKPLGQKLADKIKNRGIISGKYRMADGSHNLRHILADGAKVRRKVNMIVPLASIALGVIPGASWSDHIRHNYAKAVIEKRRNTNND